MGFRFIVAEYPDIFGDDATFERTLGALLGMAPLDRRW